MTARQRFYRGKVFARFQARFGALLRRRHKLRKAGLFCYGSKGLSWGS